MSDSRADVTAAHYKSTSGRRECVFTMAQVPSLYVSVGIITISGGRFYCIFTRQVCTQYNFCGSSVYLLLFYLEILI